MDVLLERDAYRTATGNVNWATFAQDLPNVGYETLRKSVAGERLPSRALVERVAQAVDVEPSYFLEWRLAEARAAFDPAAQGGGLEGLERAARNLEVWEQAQQAGGVRRRSRTRQPAGGRAGRRG